MTTIDDVTTAVAAYGAEQFAAGAASRQDEVDVVRQSLTRTQEQLQAALARIDELTKTAPTPTPTPPPTKTGTRFGACVLTTAAAVPSKYGKGASIRVFYDKPAGQLPWPTAPAGTLLHVSYKMAGKTYTDAQIDAMLTKARGHLITVNHEPDNDGWTATQIAAWKALNNRVYDRNVTLGRPARIVPTFTGDFWSNHTTDAERDVWLKDLKADLYGLDFDGVHDNQTSKPADLVYRVGKSEVTNADEIAALKRAMSKYGVPGFCVPEFGTSRRPWDTDGAGRTKWLRNNAQRFIDAGAEAVHWYDEQANGKDDRILDPSPEIDAMRTLVAANPA